MIITIILTIVFTFLGTKNGRALLIQSIHDGFQRAPFRIRQNLLLTILEMSPKFCRTIIYLFSCPFGNDFNWICKVKKETWQGDWIMPTVTTLHQIENTVTDLDIIILYIHGGGFMHGFSTMRMPTFKSMLKELQQKHRQSARILSVNYTKSPESVWPQAHNECVDAYRYLVHELGVSPSRIIIAGDSAGGNLAATVVLSIKNQRSQERLQDLPPLPLPAGLGLICPWSDLTPFHEDYEDFEGTDIDRPELLARYVRNYIPNYYGLSETERESLLKNPLVSPYYGDYSGVCPIFVGYGENELLAKSIKNYINRIEGFGNQLTVLEGEKAHHLWMVCPQMTNDLNIYERDYKEFVKWVANTIKDRQT